ncbi:MAG: CYTH domain-containing protein [Candidatus Aenigmarchaeota archaeon]|nr:CYTH domain-containing protein [Candidatus Aenigmarchaeota archaeon]
MEVELRAKLEKIDVILNKIKKLNSKLKYEVQQKDIIFKPLNSKKPFIFRIRSNDKKDHELTYKALTGIDGVWPEFKTKISDPEQTKKMLLEAEFYEWLVIEKIRKSFSLNEFEINVDTFIEPKDFGKWIEIEVITEDIENGKKKIRQLLDSLGIPSDDLVEKGYPRIIKGV